MPGKRSLQNVAWLGALGLVNAAVIACSSKGATGGSVDGGNGGGGAAGTAGNAGTSGSSGSSGSSGASGSAGRGTGTSGSSGSDGSSGAAGATAGGAGGIECSAPTDCPEPDNDCQVATCSRGECGIADADAGTACSEGVCSGTGFCAECVPSEGMCTAGRPQLCNADGEWATQPACAKYSSCDAGRCRSLTREWHLQAGSTTSTEMENVALDGASNVYVAGRFFADIELGGRSLSEPNTSDAFFARVPAAGGAANILFQMGSASDDSYPAISVATNGNHFATVDAGGALARGPVTTTPVGPNENFAPIVGFGGNGVLRFGQSFRSPTAAPARSVYHAAIAPAADGTTAYVALEFLDGVRWTPRVGPFEDVTAADCHTFVAKIDGNGIPIWSTTYQWCLGFGAGRRRLTALGSDGNLYIAGPSGRRGSVDDRPSLFEARALTSTSSGVLVKVNAANGAVIQLAELPCGNLGNVHALANAPGNRLVAVVSCSAPGPLRLGSEEVAAGIYVVAFDYNLRAVDHRLITTGANGFVAPTALAVNPRGEIFVAGEFNAFATPPAVAGIDFGAGLHEYEGTCGRCQHYDAFLVAYSPELELLFSNTYASPSEDWAGGVAADATHVYFGLNFKDTIDFPATTALPALALNRTGSTYSSVLLKFKLE